MCLIITYNILCSQLTSATTLGAGKSGHLTDKIKTVCQKLHGSTNNIALSIKMKQIYKGPLGKTYSKSGNNSTLLAYSFLVFETCMFSL